MEPNFTKSLLLQVLPGRVKTKVLLICFVAASAFGQWKPQKSNTDSSLHGLSVVDANVVWASGTGGTFVRTTDGGEAWQAGTVPSGEKLDFRDVYAVDAKTAYLMSIGNGNESRIYKTTDAGKSWSLQYTEQNPKAFLDCMAFWNAMRGIVVGDALDGKSELLTTSDGGAHWTPLRPESLPPVKDGEGSPASGTCIATYPEKKGKNEIWHAWFVTENASRVFHTDDAGKTWTVSEAPLVKGLNQGVFSIAVVDADRLAIVGGDYDHPQMVKPNSAYTDDALKRRLPRSGSLRRKTTGPPGQFRQGCLNRPNGQARDKAAKALGMGGRTAEKLLALVQKADGRDPEARAALDAVNEGRMSVDAAYRTTAAPKPERDAASIRKDERKARDFNWLCKAHALDAELGICFRSVDAQLSPP